MKDRLVRSLKKLVRKSSEAALVLFFVLAFSACAWTGVLRFSPDESDYLIHYTAHEHGIITMSDEEKFSASCHGNLEIEPSSHTPFKAFANGQPVQVEPFDIVQDSGPFVAREALETVYYVPRQTYDGPYRFVHDVGSFVYVEAWCNGKIAIDITQSDEDIRSSELEDTIAAGIMAVFAGFCGFWLGLIVVTLTFGYLDYMKQEAAKLAAEANEQD